MSGSTKPNRTRKATASDLVMTSAHLAADIVKRLPLRGLCLEPCRGTGNIYNALPHPKDWCEITQGRDFFSYHRLVDWIVTNPPYSIYDDFLRHTFDLADHVVVLVPLAKAFKSQGLERAVMQYGGLRQIILLGGGRQCGFPFGFLTGLLYYKRNYHGPIDYKSPSPKRRSERLRIDG